MNFQKIVMTGYQMIKLNKNVELYKAISFPNTQHLIATSMRSLSEKSLKIATYFSNFEPQKPKN